MDDLVHTDSRLANLLVRLSIDASGFDLDAPLPDLSKTNASKSNQAQIVEYARAACVTGSTQLLPSVNAFTRVQSALTRDPNASISLESLVADELRAILAREGERVRISGPSVLLHYQAAEKFALAVHELATNALEYGALSWPRGRIAVTWQLEGAEPLTRLVFAWIETGVQGLSDVPERRGFGMDLLERTLAYELKAQTTIRFTPQGLCCRIDVPLTNIVAQADAGLPKLG